MLVDDVIGIEDAMSPVEAGPVEGGSLALGPLQKVCSQLDNVDTLLLWSFKPIVAELEKVVHIVHTCSQTTVNNIPFPGMARFDHSHVYILIYNK